MLPSSGEIISYIDQSTVDKNYNTTTITTTEKVKVLLLDESRLSGIRKMASTITRIYQPVRERQ